MVRSRMDEMGMSVRDVAKEARVSHASVSFWLNGARKPSPTTNAKIASVLFLDANRLMELSGHRPMSPGDPERDAVHRLVDRLPLSEIQEVESYLMWRLVESQRRSQQPHDESD